MSTSRVEGKSIRQKAADEAASYGLGEDGTNVLMTVWALKQAELGLGTTGQDITAFRALAESQVATLPESVRSSAWKALNYLPDYEGVQSAFIITGYAVTLRNFQRVLGASPEESSEEQAEV
mgnify:CR=1 FL=1